MSTKPDTRWGNRHEFQVDPINFCRCGLHKANPVHSQSPVMPSYEELKRELAEARRDTARLDWLERMGSQALRREALDAAMSAQEGH
jgi:hypothetical protein